MKKVFILLSLAFALNAKAQDEKTVTLTVTGQGKTTDEAKTNALRSAIEQAFGAFISSNTTILNDKLIKDEIVSVANGNIQKFDVVNETTLPDGTLTETLKATVSLSKLTTFCESKGVKVEFQGSLFAMNVIMKELNKKNESLAWSNLYSIIDKMMDKCFDYKLEVKDPVPQDGNTELYKIPINIKITLNDNYIKLLDMIYEFSNSISLNPKELNSAENNRNYFAIGFNKEQVNNKAFYFRNKSVRDSVLILPSLLFVKSIKRIAIINDLDTLSIENYIPKNARFINFSFPTTEAYFFYGNFNEFEVGTPIILLHDKYKDEGFQSRTRYISALFDAPISGKSRDGEYTTSQEITAYHNEIEYYNDKGTNKVEMQNNNTLIVFSLCSNRGGDNDKIGMYVGNFPHFANFYGHNEFINLKIYEHKSLDEIKKIKEFKIIHNY